MPRSEFRSLLVAVPYNDGATWWLYRPLIYAGSIQVRVPRGFETDFASVPRTFTNLFPRFAEYGRASVIHDWLYWTQTVPREQADALFLEAMEATSVAAWKRRILYRAVRAFGHVAWSDNARLVAQGYSRMHSTGREKEWSR